MMFMFIFGVFLLSLGIAAGALIPSVSDDNVFGLLTIVSIATRINWN